MTRKIRYKEAPENLIKLSTPQFDQDKRASIGMEKFVGEFFFINIDKLVPYKNQARTHFDMEELKNLSETIKAHGIRQPLTITNSDLEEGKYEVVSGERRLRAAKMAGLEKVPCILLDKTSQKDEIALIENIQRADLHPIELARSLKKLMDQFGWGGQTEIEKRLGIPQEVISEHIKLLNFSEEIQTLIISKNYSGRDNLRSLLKMKDDNEIKKSILEKEQAKKEKKNTISSVLRLSYSHDILKVQKNSLKRLSSEQKREVKKMLLEILDELEK